MTTKLEDDIGGVMALADHVHAALQSAPGNDRRQGLQMQKTIVDDLRHTIRHTVDKARKRLTALSTLYDLAPTATQAQPARSSGRSSAAPKRRALAIEVKAALDRSTGSVTAKQLGEAIHAPSNEVARVLRRLAQRGEATCDPTVEPPTFQAAREGGGNNGGGAAAAAGPEEAAAQA